MGYNSASEFLKIIFIRSVFSFSFFAFCHQLVLFSPGLLLIGRINQIIFVIDAFTLPFAKSSDLRQGSIVRTEERYSGEFSIGFLKSSLYIVNTIFLSRQIFYPCNVSEYRFGNFLSLVKSSSDDILFPCKQIIFRFGNLRK